MQKPNRSCWIPDFPALEIGFDQWAPGMPPTLLREAAGNRMYPRPTKGQRNTVTKATVRRFGNAGIVTSQLANEI